MTELPNPTVPGNGVERLLLFLCWHNRRAGAGAGTVRFFLFGILGPVRPITDPWALDIQRS